MTGSPASPPRSDQAAGAGASLWRHSDFLKLWAAQAISSLGARITRDGLPLTAVLVLHANAGDIGRLAAMAAAPALAVGLLAGGLVDRSRRRPLLIAADLARAALLFIIPIAALAHALTMAALIAAAASVAGLSVLFDMADHAYLPVLVEPAQLIDANTKLGTTESVAEIGGPAVAGILVSALTAPIAIAANAATYLISAAILAGIGKVEPTPAARPSMRHWRADIAAGLKLAAGEPRVRPLFAAALSSGLFGGFFSALYIVYAIDVLRLTPALLGLTIAVGGVGSLAGAALATRLAQRLGIGVALIAAGTLNALFDLFIPLAGGGRLEAMALLMTAQFFGDAAGTAWLIYAKTLRQGLLPNQMLGRVAGVFAAASGLAMIFGALIGGELGQRLGARPTLLFACAGFALAPLVCLASPLRRLRAITPARVEASA